MRVTRILLAFGLLCWGLVGSAAAAPTIYVSQTYPYAVTAYDSLSGEYHGMFTEFGGGGIRGPGYALFGPDGNLYVTGSVTVGPDDVRTAVQRYGGVTGKFIDNFVLGPSTQLEWFTSILFTPDDDLLVLWRNSSRIRRYDIKTGELREDWFVPAGSGGLGAAIGMVYGPDGNLYVSSSHNNKINRYNGQTGAFINEFVPSLYGGLYNPTYMLFGSDGDLYTKGSHPIKRYDGGTGEYLGEFGPNTGSGGMRFGPDGNLYSATWGTRVNVLDGETGVMVNPELVFIPNSIHDVTFRGTDPVTLAYTSPYSPPTDGGGGVTFKLDIGEVVGDGVEPTDLGALIHGEARAEGANDADYDLDEIYRRFVFEREDGLSDPQNVFLNGALTGQLISEGDGVAGFRATVSLLDPTSFDILDSGEIAITRDATVHGDGEMPLDGLLFGALATLVPGNEYLLHAQLTATAETGADPNSLAHAWLAHSLDVQLSGVAIPEPSTISLAAVGLLGLVFCGWRRRRRSC